MAVRIGEDVGTTVAVAVTATVAVAVTPAVLMVDAVGAAVSAGAAASPPTVGGVEGNVVIVAATVDAVAGDGVVVPVPVGVRVTVWVRDGDGVGVPVAARVGDRVGVRLDTGVVGPAVLAPAPAANAAAGVAPVGVVETPPTVGEAPVGLIDWVGIPTAWASASPGYPPFGAPRLMARRTRGNAIRMSDVLIAFRGLVGEGLLRPGGGTHGRVVTSSPPIGGDGSASTRPGRRAAGHGVARCVAVASCEQAPKDDSPDTQACSDDLRREFGKLG